MGARCVGEAFGGEELADRGEPLEPRHERAERGELHLALVWSKVRRERERDVEPVGRQRVGGAVRPFEQHHGVGGLVDAELGELARLSDAEQVGMHHRKRGSA